MVCPKCEGKVRVIDNVSTPDNEMLRKRVCLDCGEITFSIEHTVSPGTELSELMKKWQEHHRFNPDKRKEKAFRKILKGER